MKGKICIPDKLYFKKAYKLLYESEIKLGEKRYDYYHINEKIYDLPEFKKLIESNTGQKIIKISSGTSDRLTFKPFLEAISKNLADNKYYRNYNGPKGNYEARQALTIKENLKFDNKQIYNPYDFVLAEGTTGAISMVFEYIKSLYQDSEVIIGSPTYYLYKFLAKYCGLKYKESLDYGLLNSATPSFISIQQIIKKINNKTRLIILVQPNNPTGEIYQEKELRRLIKIVKEKKILLLIDELFFELIFNNNVDFKNTDFIAEYEKALENIVIVKGFSKTRNVPGLRIGYAFSKNKQLMDRIEVISEQRQCFAGASNYTDIIVLDSFIQSLDFLEVDKLRQLFNFSDVINNKTSKELINLYMDYQKYRQNILNYYSKNYDLAIETLQDEVSCIMPKKSAFNTFVKIKDLDSINYFDFCFNLYLTCGIETQIGPCYSFDQKTWQQNPKLGFWIRITFSRERKQFLDALKRLIKFKYLYLRNTNKFLKTDLLF